MEFLFLDHCAQVKGLISGMKAKVLAEGTDIDPEQLLKQAEDEIHMEMVVSEIAKTKEVLNNSGNWLDIHPLEVCLFIIMLEFYEFFKKKRKNFRLMKKKCQIEIRKPMERIKLSSYNLTSFFFDEFEIECAA